MCNDHHSSDAVSTRILGKDMHRRDLVRGLWTGSMVLMATGAAGCVTNPETGNQNFLLFAPDDASLKAMALQAWNETKKETPISRDRAANALMGRVGPKIAQAANRPNDDWEFVVFDSEEKNAFVLPGGKVGFYKGLIDFSDSEDQVAAVLGHEVGHVTDRHAAQRISQQTAAQLGLAIGGVAVSASDMDNSQKQLIMAGLGVGATVGLILPFSRQQELAADKLGVRYMHAAGYDAREAVRLWEKMGSSGGAPPEWMSTHPSPQTRVRELREFINNNGYGLA
ncbi:M48 family metalloprotease [bacterium]|nr:M48 family metalloprotease [bacterium]